MRERLIELLKAFRTPICEGLNFKLPDVEAIADYLIAEGVIVPPVWVGSTIYYIYDILGEWCMQEMRVTLCTFDEQGLYSLRAKSLNGNQDLPFTRHHPYYHLAALRFTKEEAEKALAEREGKQ